VSASNLQHASARKWLCYVRALAELVSGRGHQWFTRIEEQSEIKLWPALEAGHLFFDIDDTLNAHRQGLTKEICCWLNDQMAQGKTVVLLTNCSESRAEEHRQRLLEHDCQAELWPVGAKPDVVWLKKSIDLNGWLVSDCAMYGDRPTMDMWLAMRAGFSERIWVKGWGKNRRYRHPLSWIQGLEWYLLK
jgi:predicted HAD superfamily phosphohydrolase YqeG